TLMAGVLVGNASLQVLMDREIAIAAPADMELTVADGGENTGGLPAGTVEKLRARGELKDITPYRTVSLKGPDGEGKQASDLDISKLPPLAKLDAMSGSLARIGPGEVVLARDAADTYHATTGDTVTVSASNGGQRASLRVVATLPDDAPLHVAMLMNPTDLTTLGASAATTGVLANVAKDGEDARTSAITAVRTVTRSGRLDVLADKRDDIEKGVAAVVGIALGLIGLTVVIAVVGVGTTTALSVVERIRESGLLRAVGLSRIGLRTMLTTEAGLYGAVGAVMGVLLGVPYAWLSVLALGIDAPVSLPAGQLALVMVILAALTALAGLLPARRAAKVSPVAALGSDE
ncbi:MAG: putative transport system permease protein, partial [Cryptosporangiaceae bacterium]|nr:putative transport system permease protein [Cryptosporangiaceae bacterium]